MVGGETRAGVLRTPARVSPISALCRGKDLNFHEVTLTTT